MSAEFPARFPTHDVDQQKSRGRRRICTGDGLRSAIGSPLNSRSHLAVAEAPLRSWARMASASSIDRMMGRR